MIKDGKILPLNDLAQVLESARGQGKRITLCHGIFDIVHPGHIIHLEQSGGFGDLLVVSITPDRFVNKGPERPVFNERLRMETIAALGCVDYVALNEWPTSVETIHKLKPHIYVKGSEYADADSDLTGNIAHEEDAVRTIGGELRFTDGQVFSSSYLANRFFDTYTPETEGYLREFRSRHSAEEVITGLKSVANVRVLVVGEAILDQYYYCHPLAKSPREFIIGTRFISEENFAGGSVAIANHLAGLCGQVTLVAGFGPDEEQLHFIRSKLKPNVQLRDVRTPDRPTVTKRRYLDPNFLTKMFEVQFLEDTPLPAEVEDELTKVLDKELVNHDVVLASDFGHGLITERLRLELASSDRFLGVNTQTNSANYGFNVVTKYPRADYVCIDEPELWLATRDQYGDVPRLAAGLRAQLGARNFMVTRGKRGAVLITEDDQAWESPALSGRVIDRVGAGDAVFAVTTPCVYQGLPGDMVGFIGNCVGAMAVEIVGNREPVDPIALQKFISRLLK